MTKTVLQIVQHLKPGGIETMALDLQQHLPDCTVHIVSLEGDKADALALWPRLKDRAHRLHFLDKESGLSLETLFKMARLISTLKADVVHTHHIGPLTYGGIAARLCGVKHLVHTEHDAWHLESTRAARLERRLLHLLKPKLVADCELVASRLRALSAQTSPRVIYNGIDTRRFSPPSPAEKQAARDLFQLPKDKTLIGCAARLEKIKGITFLISALIDLPEDVHLVLAGDGNCRDQLQDQVRTSGLSTRVTFLGRIEQMDRFYKAIDIFCLPSLNEGFPLSPLEAQACDIPVVMSDVGGAREALCPKTGTLIEPKNIQALTKALNEKLVRPLENAPRHFVTTRADIQQMSTAYAKLFA